MRPVFADPGLQASFAAQGFVRVPMLDRDQLARLMSEIAALRPADGFAPDGSGFAGNSYHCTFLDTDTVYKRAAFDLLSRHFAHVLTGYLADYRILSTNFYVKPPGQGDLRVHQNWPVLRDPADTSVTIWCPLVDVDVANGTLHVVPASHKLLPHVEGPNSLAYFVPFLDSIYDHMTPLPAPAGEGFIFDDSIIHGSPPNRSKGPRVAVQITCVPMDSSPVFFFSDGGSQFELIDADADFYINQAVDDLFTRQAHWRCLGQVENRNRQIDEAEFLHLLSQGDAIRRGEAIAEPLAATSRGIRERLRRIRGRARRAVAAAIPNFAKPVIKRLLGRKSRPNPIRDARQPRANHQIAQVRSYYEDMTPAYVAGFGEIFQGSRPESTDALLDYLVDAAAIEDGMRVLDAGCGVGGPATGIAARRAVIIEGLTLAQAQVDQAARRIEDQGFAGRVRIRRGDFHAIGSLYEPESFDRVLFLESLCHAESYAEVLGGAHRVLKTGGALYIKDFYCVDNRARPGMAAGQAADLEKLNSLYRLQLPDLASMVDLLSGLGFVIRYMRMPDYIPSYRHWAAYEQLAGAAWNPASAEPGDIIQAIEFFCWKR